VVELGDEMFRIIGGTLGTKNKCGLMTECSASIFYTGGKGGN
jgi:hypothetical protein